MHTSIDEMKEHILEILSDNVLSIYLFGSVVLDDFKLGWSDIDILCLTKNQITDQQAEQLLFLRQSLLNQSPDNLYYRSFEGGFLSLEAFLNNSPELKVYWGTSGQRITEQYIFDPFSMMELIDYGSLIHGKEIRSLLQYPSPSDQRAAITNHYHAIRKYGANPSRSLYSVGWLLDIARCIYTLETGKIIAKTAAGEWALSRGIVPDTRIMLKVLEIRNNPNQYKTEAATLDWIETLGPQIQEFADVLEKHLKLAESNE